MDPRPVHASDLIIHTEAPFNAETPAAALMDSITPEPAFYVRSHGSVPDIDRDHWRLEVGGEVQRPLRLSLQTLREAFPERTVTATVQCAGNRRAGLIAIRDIPGESPWGPGATGTAEWTGVALSDVLAAAGSLPSAGHVGFEGADSSLESGSPERYGGSIPLDKARRSEVLLAWAMNGAALTAAHGAPVRVVVPGYIGARSVKWLERIELRAGPWEGHFQRELYRLVSAAESPGPGVGIELGLIALNSDILAPADNAEVPPGRVEVHGYAFAGGDRSVERVDVSIDQGQTWRPAELLDDLGRWAWRHWRAAVELPAGEHEVRIRAWDSSAATQPEDEAALWNPKGYVNNAQPRVRLHVSTGSSETLPAGTRHHGTHPGP